MPSKDGRKILKVMARTIVLDHRIGVLTGLERNLIELVLAPLLSHLNDPERQQLIGIVQECLEQSTDTIKQRQKLLEHTLRSSVLLGQLQTPVG